MSLSCARITVTCLIIVVCVVFSQCQDFFIVNRYKPDEYYCITNSSNALSWVDEDTSQDIHFKASRFIPSPTEKNLWSVSCNSKNDQSPLGWNCETALSGTVILDRRWEDLQEYKTDYNEESNDNMSNVKLFINIPITLEENFTLPLSIRIKENAHIYLCDGKDPPNSNCYWISIGTGALKKTILQKCSSSQGASDKKENCFKQRAVFANENLNSAYWTHFKLFKTAKTLLFTYENNGKSKEIFSCCNEDNKIFSTTNLIISSTNFVGRWKFHQITYYKTTKAQNDTPFGSPLKPIGDSVCISVFINMCESCQITFKLTNQENRILIKKTYGYEKDWREIRFNTDEIKDIVTLLVSTHITTKEENQKQFWALDNMKQCHRDGFRMISLDKSASCQLLSENGSISVTRNKINDVSANCRINSVGKSCIPCSWFLNDKCGQLKICEKHNDAISCSCSAGYTTSNSLKCDTKCPNGSYDHQCKNNCYARCKSNNCSHLNGRCTAWCTNKNDTCNIWFVELLTLKNASYEEAVVEVSNTELIGDECADCTYILQYKEVEENKQQWHTVLENNTFIKTQLIKVEGLKPDTKYCVRYLAVKDKNTYSFNEDIPKICFFSLCEEIQETDLKINVFDTIITISTYSKKNSTICKLKKSWIKEHNFNARIYVSDTEIILSNLNPDANYTVEISPKLKLFLKTQISPSKSKQDSHQKNRFNLSDGCSEFESFGVSGFKPSLELYVFLFLVVILLILIAVVYVVYRIRLSIKRFRFPTEAEDEPIYSEIVGEKILLRRITKSPSVYSKNIKVFELEDYIKKASENGELESQYSLVPRGQIKPWNCGALEANKHKNRYPNLLAYDHTRVILRKNSDNKNSDYINANYIDGYKVPKAYIATQGPKLSTVEDFWRMIWQENVQHIVMLANIYEEEEKKVEKYWPNTYEVFNYGNIQVQHIDIKVYADYEHRLLKVTKQDITREVHQYQFLSWQNHKDPLYSQPFISFLAKLQKLTLSSEFPIVVHGSAGVGRTGLIILCDICLRMAAEENCVDIWKTLQELRDQRANMVNTFEQYKLAHLVILDYLVGKRTGIQSSEIEKVEDLLGSRELNKQMQYVENIAWWDQVMLYERNDFLSTKAITVNGFKHFYQFIITQQPKSETLPEFWKLVHEKKIQVIVSLNNSKIWPSEGKNQLNPVDYLTLKCAKIESYNFYNIITVHMYIKNNLENAKEYKVVEIVSMKEWPATKLCPSNVEHFLDFWKTTYEKFKQSNQVIVTCFDGVVACGLYVAMSFVLEKINLEHICDVCQAVRVVRNYNSKFVTNKEQFVFLHKAAMVYVNKFQSYSNFK